MVDKAASERFELLERVAAGGGGAVYRAKDRSTGEIVAFKELHGLGQDDGARFARECGLLSSLTSPGIVRYVAHGFGKPPWLAMEWVEGTTLAKLLKERGLTWAESVGLMSKVAAAVGALHRRGIVHRDIKPSNVILEGGDPARPKLIDLGIARPEGEPLTMTGVVVGTAGYMAPEQARGERDIDARADVFALGCLLFRALTGEPPFKGDSALAVMLRVTLEDAPRLSEVDPRIPVELDDICACLLARDRDTRPKDGAEVARLLDEIEPVESVPTRRSVTDLGAVTTTERRLVFLVLVRSEEALASKAARALAEAIAPLGLRPETVADGTVVIAVVSEGSAGDLAFRAARAALAARAVFKRARATITIGRTADARAAMVGEAADRATSLMATLQSDGKPGEIAVDAGTARLLADRFVIRPRPFGGVLGAVDLGGAFVGREREIAYLTDFVGETASERRAGAVVVLGPAGAGKSRLARELLDRLGDRQEVWVVQGDPLTSSTPFGMLRPLFLKLAGVGRSEPKGDALAKLRGLVEARLGPTEVERVASFLAELLGVAPDDAPTPAVAAARRDPTLMGDQLRRAMGELVGAACLDRAVVVVIEDLQWADHATVTFFAGLLSTLETLPLCILGLGRPQSKATYARLLGDAGAQELKLEALSKAASERLCAALMGVAAIDGAVERLVERAGGNPFFLEELVRAARGGGAGALPDSVLSVLEARLEALPSMTRRTLRAASVFGRRFWEAGLRALVPKADVAAHLEVLEQAEIIRASSSSRFDGHAEWAFRSSALFEASYARLPREDRVRAHRAAARWLEAAGESDPTLLAEHYERGGEAKSAVGLLAGAAHLALEAGDFDQAVALAERAARCGAEGAELGALLADESEARMWLGQNPEALAAAKRALELVEVGSPAWCRSATVAVTAGSRTQDRSAAARILEAVLTLEGGEGAPPEHTNLIAQAAIQLVFLGSLDAADRVLSRVPAGLAHRDPAQAAWIFRARAWRALAAGDPAAYGMLMRHSAIAFGEIGDGRNACVQHVNVAYAAMLLGQYDEAVDGLRAVASEAKSLGLTSVAAVARHNLGLALARTGKLAAAEAEETLAVEAFRAQGDKRMLAASLGYLAQICLAAGKQSAAEDAARRAVDESPDRTPIRAIVLATLADTLLERAVGKGSFEARPGGEASAEAAFDAAKRARELLGALGGVDEGETAILGCYARALAAVGREGEARAAAIAAGAKLRDRSERLSPAHRTSFLRRVPENVAILALLEWLDEPVDEFNDA